MTRRRSISRRSFFKMAGLFGASVAAKDVPSSRSSGRATRKLGTTGKQDRPWWVRTVEQPTTKVDWDRIERFDARDTVRGAGLKRYVGTDEAERIREAASKLGSDRLKMNFPGFTLKDHAMESAQRSLAQGARSYLGPQRAPTPQDRGMPKWQGPTDEAARILRVAMRHFGAATVGFVELNRDTRKLIYSHDPDGRQLVFTNTDQAKETTDERTIPSTAKWLIAYTVQMSNETFKRAPAITADQTTMLCYARGLHVQIRTQEFLRGLGYQGLGESSTNALGIGPAFAVLAGLGELSRQNRLITPEFGPMVRVFKMITDLPVTVDKPIDAGIIEFCRHCKKCAEACPAGALSLDDEPSWEVRGGWSNPGHEAYFEDSLACERYRKEGTGTGCGICFSVCPFSKKNKVWIHEGVKAAISTVPFLDPFLRAMDDAFSYGARKDPEEWWELDLPEYGIDSEASSTG